MDCKWEGKDGEVADDACALGLRGESKDDPQGAKASSQDIVTQVQQFFYENDDFANKFEAFVADNSHIVDLSSEENKLEYTRVYNKFQDLFEAELEGFIRDRGWSVAAFCELRERLEGFIRDRGWSVAAFCELLRAANDRDPLSSEAIFGQIVAATADFDMMREAARAQASDRK
ncbi:hypothetical protein JKP88DRAFT_273601 [Tribonema minus]|uniref:Cilia- and flagella-associated protein 36 n=1 Tax=Tribonema minus TaxID=303371 RepID=A0A836CC87_9STRA|nr:hypothetical protein JKP88DRAFT_273601 [Tribonema minus]